MKTATHPRTRLRQRVLYLAVLSCFGAQNAPANPTGPAVVNGQARFANQGNALSVTNTPNAIINWQGFSIDRNETTRFLQQSASSAVLNRVVGQNPSLILGTLQSNGRVFLINSTGIVFGQGSRIDVAGLVASTLNLSNQDFLAGRLNFASGTIAGTIKNRGTIATPSGGSVILVAPQIENSGIINAPNGDVILAAGHSVRLGDTAAPNVLVEIQAPDTQAINVGEIVVGGGSASIYAGLIKQQGVVSANTVSVTEAGKIVFKATQAVTLAAGSKTTANGASGGQITVQADNGTDLVLGDVSATGATAKGGDVRLLGTQVGVAGSAKIDASGAGGGGSILLGGDYKGNNPAIQNAHATFLGEDAALLANATTRGDGGRIILWSNDVTRAFGSIQARGGARGGDGGFVETSSAGTLLVPVGPDLSAPKGTGGTWLIDPFNITVVAGTVLHGNSGAPDFTPTDNGSQIGATLIGNQLSSGTNVTLTTTGHNDNDAGDITLNAPITMTSGAPLSATLTLDADNDIFVNAQILNKASAALSLSMVAAGTITLDAAINVASASLHGSAIVEGASKPKITTPTLSLGTVSRAGGIGSQANPILTSGVSHLTTSVSGSGDTAVQNTNGAGGDALTIDIMTSRGGTISLVNDSDISLDQGQINSFGGNIRLQSTAGSILGEGQIVASASSLTSELFPNGGNITVVAAGDVNLTGVRISSAGFSPMDGTTAAGRGGNIDIHAVGSIDVQAVSALGGNGNSGSASSAAGGAGGTITLTTGSTLTVRSAALADGGTGASSVIDAAFSGAGGAGGFITLTTSDSSVATGLVSAKGGAGGDALCANCNGAGGAGGAGGSAKLQGSRNVSANQIDVSGGAAATVAGLDGADVSGGNGGTIGISLLSPGKLSVAAPDLRASGGAGAGGRLPTGPGGGGGSVLISSVSGSPLQQIDPGTLGGVTLAKVAIDVGAGAGPNSGGQGFVELQAGKEGIVQSATAASPFTLNTTDLQIVTPGLVTLTNQSNVIPGIWGSVGGNLSVTSLGPIQLGLAHQSNFSGAGLLTVGGNLIVRSVAGGQRTVSSCIDAPDSCVYFDQPVSAGGNIEFYANDVHDEASVTTGQQSTNYYRHAPWTANRDAVFDPTDPIQAGNLFAPRLQFGNPEAIANPSLATWGTVTIAGPVEPSSFTSVTKISEVYAHRVDMDVQIGATNPVPMSFVVKALGDINIGRNVQAAPTSIHLADGSALTLIANAHGDQGGNLSIGRDGVFTNIDIDYVSTPSAMTLRGENVYFRGPMSVVANGPGTQTITGTTSVQFANNSTGNLFVNGQGAQQITAGSGGILLDAVVGNVYVTGGGDFVNSVFQGTGSQTILADGPSTSLIVRAGLGQVNLNGREQTITVGTGTNTGSIVIQGGTVAQTTADITNFGGPQHVSTTGQLRLAAGSAPDQGQGNFHCDLEACANLGNETGSTGQFVSAIGGITVTGGTGGGRNEANIYSRSGQTIDAPGGITLTAGAGAGPGNWASLADVGGTSFTQNISFGTGGITLHSDNVGGNDSTANIHADGSQVIAGTSDIVLTGGTAGFMSWSHVEAGTGQDITARAISIKALAGAGSTGFFTNDGAQHIATTGGLGGAASEYGIKVQNLGALGPDQGGFTSAAHITSRNGSQSITVSGSHGILISADKGLAIIDDEGTTQTIKIAGAGALDILSGLGSAQVFFDNGSAQTISAGSIALTGGTADKALALIEANHGTQSITTTGALALTGGTAPGRTITDLSTPQPPCGEVTACAVVIADAGQQTISANSISLTGGSQGNENLATLRGNVGQDITVGSGGLSMQGGTGTGIRNYAFIENYGGDQILRFAAGAPLTLTGGTVGIKHFAAIMAMGTSTSQQILGNPAITLTGGASGGGDGSGSFATFTGSNAYIGTDPDGTVATSQTINAQSILLQGAFGPNNAAIDNFRVGAQQSITALGDIRLIGGPGASALAELYSRGDQTVQANSITMNGTSGGGFVAIHVDGGGTQRITTTGSNTNGWGVQLTNNNATNRVYVETTGSQTITASNGGGVLLDAIGGEVDVKGGTQTIQIDGTGANALTVRGHAATARIEGENQSIVAGTGSNAGSILVQGGNANGANGYIFNQAGPETISTSGSLTVTAGTGTSTSQNLFACDPSACALIGNIAATSQSITAGTISISGGASGSYNEASIYTNGSQVVHATGGIQLRGGAGTGNYASLAVSGGKDSTQSIDFGSGNLSLLGGSSGGRSFAMVYSDGAQTISGQGDIVMSGGVLPNAGTPATVPQRNGPPVTDAVVYSWAEISNNGADGAAGAQSISARSISITARAGQSSTGIFTPAGQQQIATSGAGSSGYGLKIENLGASETDQNNSPASAYIYNRSGTQSIDIANSGGLLLKGTAAPAFLGTNGPAQTVNIHGSGTKALDLLAGTGSANLYFGNTTAQTNQGQSITAGSLSLTGGSQNGAFATIDAANGTQTVKLTGALSLHGGAAPGPAHANADTPPSNTTSNSANATLISRHGKQTISAGSITITGGGGTNENYADIVSDGGQDITVGAGGITLTGGTGTGVHNFAMIENYDGDQIIRLAAGSALDIIGGSTGVRNFAGIWGGGPISYQNAINGVPDQISTAGTTSQQILGSPNIAVAGGATGGGGDGTEGNTARRGNTGFIIAQTGPQHIDARTVTLIAGGGAGENAAGVETFANGAAQTINATGTISLTGGTALFADAKLISGGAQTISATGITLAGGSASGLDSQNNPIGNASARVQANGAQSITIIGGGTIKLTGGTNSTGGASASNSAEISSASGFDQTVTFHDGGTIVLTGGSSGRANDARIGSGHNQTISGNPAVTLTGGAGDSGQASIDTEGGAAQTLNFRSLSMTGGSGADASASIDGGTNQTIAVTGAASLTGGTGSSAVAQLQSLGDQSVSAKSIQLIAGDGGATAGIQAQGGNQTITTSGSGPNGWGIELTNNGASRVYIEATGAQHITATNGGGILLNAAGGNVDFTGGEQSGGGVFVPNGAQTIVGDGSGANAIVLRGGHGSADIKGEAQSITAGTGSHSGSIVLQGGASNGGNAEIFTQSGTQTIATTGQIAVTAGTGTSTSQGLFACGPSACALIGNLGPGNQSITADAISISGGASGSYNEASIFTNGSQVVHATRGIQLTGGAGTGNYASLAVSGGKDSTQAVDFGTGNLSITGGMSGGRSYATVYSDGAQTISGKGDIVLLGGALPNAGTPATAPQKSGPPVTDAVVYSWAEISANGADNAAGMQSIDARSISITARPGQSSTGIYSAAGQQRITTSGVGSSGYGMMIRNSGASGTDQNDSAATAYISNKTGTQSIDIANSGGLLLSGGTLSGTGNVTVSGATTLSGATMTGAGSTITEGALTISGPIGLDAGRVLDIRGGATWTAGDINLNAASDTGSGKIVNRAGSAFTTSFDGTIFAQTHGAADDGTSALFTNEGTFTRSAGTGTTTIHNTFNNSGTVDVQAGTLAATGGLSQTGVIEIASGATLSTSGNSLTNAASGVIKGEGTINLGSGTLFNDGTIAPGGASSPTATLSVQGNFTQRATGTLAIDLAGAASDEYDRLAVTGAASLGGTLSATLLGGFVPSGTQQFQIVTASSGINGDLASLNLPAGLSRLINPNNVVLAFGGIITCAGTICWDNSDNNGLWTDPQNWNRNVLPGPNDTVVIDLGGGTFVVLDSGTHTIASLLAAEHLEISGGSLSVTGTSTFNGGLTVSGGGFTGSGAISANLVNLSSGSFTVVTTALINALNLTGGVVSGAGAVTVNGSWIATGGRIALDQTSGSLSIAQTNGDLNLAIPVSANAVTARALNGNLTLASDMTASGAVSLTASGSVVQNSNSLIRGSNVTLTAGGDVTLGQVTAIGPNPSTGFALSAASGTAGSVGIDAQNANLTAQSGSISLTSPTKVRVGSGTAISAASGSVTITAADFDLTADYTLPSTFTLLPFATSMELTGTGHTLTSLTTLSQISNVTVNFVNEGTVAVPAAMTTVFAAGGSGAGSYTLADTTSLLRFDSGAYTLGNIAGTGGVSVTGATVAVGGTYSVTGTTNINSQAQMNINGTGTLGTLNVSGTLGGSGAVSSTVLNLNGGSLAGTGSLTVSDFVETGGPRAITSYNDLALTRQQGNFAVGQYTAGNSLSLTAAGGSLLINDVALTAPTVSLTGANVTLQPTTSKGSQVDAANSLSISTPGALSLSGANGPAKLTSGNTMSIDAATVNVTAGNFAAKIDPTRLDLTATGNVVLTGGSAPNATAVVSGNDVTVNAANVILNGGAGSSSYATIEGVAGNTTVTAASSIILNPGTGPNADASIIAPAGTVALNGASCTGCVILPSNPLQNSETDQGLFGSSLVLNVPLPVTSNPALASVQGAIIQGTTLAGQGGQADTTLSTSETDEEHQGKQASDKQSSDKQGQASGNKPKRTIPACI